MKRLSPKHSDHLKIPNKSAIDAIRVTRERCRKQDRVLKFDIKGLVGNISHYYKVFRQLNKALVRRARRKYKALRRHKSRACRFIHGIAEQNPGLFAHWRIGMVGSFV